ncbi:pyruvate, phosphate dikinase [Vagococcus silagei]|uniref:Pyruvate, phosphate dikinase n=1 Tax=Vagococcus silagei TaxID=2508885 RepID=A0A4S3B4N9_9ENTE|nr:pyruvate, phosphate dikinase [Vagococcus silagei]THB61257.1 pyruvate, phosphate dikinase [Vagococcus silagei]
MSKQVYQFNEGQASMRDLLGGKGANLAEMTRLGLPVPPGFTITTEACIEYLENGKTISTELKKEIERHLVLLEDQEGKKFGSSEELLLISVRSGSKYSMPGMMDTILNLGLNDESVKVLAKMTNNEVFAYDCYRRLIQMFGNVVYGIDGQQFESLLDFYKSKYRVKQDSDLTSDQLKDIVEDFKRVYLENKRQPFPQDPKEQLLQAVEAVFSSWNNERAFVYRNLHNIDHFIGTAVNIQAMVFGNSGNESGTGVVFSRHPATGEKELFGEYLINAQGEDVVAGIRTPQSIHQLKKDLPECYDELNRLVNLLETHYLDMQDIEFTIDNKKLYLLQTRNGKRTAKSAVKIAVDMVSERLITKEEAIMMIRPESIVSLLYPVFDEKALAEATLISDKGLPASPGSATGKVYFDADSAKAAAASGEKVVLIRQETSPEDIGGMVVSEAIVTSRGGMTSHAAVVARGMGTCCVAGCSELEVNELVKQVTFPGGVIKEGDVVSVDGSVGALYVGAIAQNVAEQDENLEMILKWSRELARLEVRMNAETVNDIQTGLDFHASGIGLIRTEHMFFAPERLKEMRRFILADTFDERKMALKTILMYQIQDFKQIFATIGEKPGVIRLLDPPLHEFVPSNEKEFAKIAQDLNVPVEKIASKVNELHEINPMLGHRGCRLAVTYPELYIMQAEAIIKSIIALKKEKGIIVEPEIMIPLVGTTKELTLLKEKIVNYVDQLLNEEQCQVVYTIGTMIEIPRACFIADQIAESAEFLSFGTNDLTQLTFGYSRDDAGKFIHQYLEEGILMDDPFQTIDLEGVGELVQTAVVRARKTRPAIKIGVCGELGGDPRSIDFFNRIGLDYVSCSPFRLPIAYIAAARSQIEFQEKVDVNK